MQITNKEIAIRNDLIKFWKELRFDVGVVDTELMKNIKLEDIKSETSPIQWLSIERYSMTNEIIKKINSENKVPVQPLKFLGNISKLEEIDGIKVCLFLYKERWAALIANQTIQRTISLINSGDGWDKICQFAVEPKSAP